MLPIVGGRIGAGCGGLGGIVGRNCAMDVWLTIANPAKPRQNELNPIRKELESFIKHPLEINLKFQLIDRVSKNYINVLSIENSWLSRKTMVPIPQFETICRVWFPFNNVNVRQVATCGCHDCKFQNFRPA